MIPFKKITQRYFVYLPGALILIVSMVALHASLTVNEINTKLHSFHEVELSHNTDYENKVISALEDKAQHAGKRLYWYVWILGFSGFVLVLMNVDKLRRLAEANRQTEESLELLEAQLQSIQKSEREKTALQEQLHQAQKLEAVGRLAGGIAHDFNNILAAINGYTEFLIDDLKPKSQEHGFAQNIMKAGAQARELIDKMLTFSRRDRDETMQFNMADPFDETLSMLKASLPKSVEVITDCNDDNYIIHGNPTSISQALMNLALNAKDAMPNEKGNLMLSLSRADMEHFQEMGYQENLPATSDMPLVAITDVSATHTRLTLGKLARNQDYMCLSVADSGTGMTRMIMEHIFEPFFTTKTVDKGTGLGLAMVHGVVASHRGAMQINSIAGKGTRFDLLFPILGRQTDAASPPTKNEHWKAVGNILLVEDKDDVRDMMKTMLERLGFDVETCDGALAAKEIIEEHPDYFNVVVTDQNMPKMSGIELVQDIAPKYPSLPFVIVSGYSIEEMRDIMKEHPSVKAILKKPIDREKLLEAVQAASLESQFAA